MSYVQNGTIEYGDVNKFATGSPTGIIANPAVVNINSLWGTGYGNVGYGQTGSLPLVAQNSVVSTSNWSPLVSTLNQIYAHQTGQTGSLVAPSKGSTIRYIEDYNIILQSLWNARLNSYALGTNLVEKTYTISTGWKSTISATFNVTFSSGDNARYFFNCGGLIKTDFFASKFSSTSTQAVTMNVLCNQTGTLYLGSPNNTTATIGSKVFNGFTQFTPGSIATRTIYNPAIGYYGLTTVKQPLYKLVSATYPNTYLQVSAKTNGPQGVNGDNGNIITIYAEWVASPASSTNITGIFETKCNAVLPETTYLANSWGTPTLTLV